MTDRHFAEEDALERRLYGSPDAVSEEEEEEEEEEKEEEDAGVREEGGKKCGRRATTR